MKRTKARFIKNSIIILLVLASLMLISCSCADFGFVLDGDGIVVVPNFHPTYNDGADRVESEKVTEKETERETIKCSHEWAPSDVVDGYRCIDEYSLQMHCTKQTCEETKIVTARGACKPDSNGICKYCGERATDIAGFSFVRRGDKYYEAYLKADFDERTVIFPDHYLDMPVKLIGSEGPNGTVVEALIPASVSQIFDGAFRNFTNLTSVYIEEGTALKNIRTGAFSGCKKLTYIPLERCNNLATIMGSAFADCASLESITIPASVTSILDDAFRRCYKLSDIKILNEKVRFGDFVFAEIDALTDISFIDLQIIPKGMF